MSKIGLLVVNTPLRASMSWIVPKLNVCTILHPIATNIEILSNRIYIFNRVCIRFADDWLEAPLLISISEVVPKLNVGPLFTLLPRTLR